MNQSYDHTLLNMEASHSILAGRLRGPQAVPFGEHSVVLRYAEQGIHQALIQKLARVVSGLHAARLLMQHGFFQEQGALQRMLDEFNEDVSFLAHAVISGHTTDLHREYLAAFYQEEFDEPDDAIASAQKRPMIPRQKIRAYLSQIHGGVLDPSSGVRAMRTVQKIYSGFVHGASPHTMDMYVGSPPRWHLRGLLGTIRQKDHEEDLWNAFYRSIGSFALATKAFGDESLFDSWLQYMREFAAAAGEHYAHPTAKDEA